MASTYTTNKVLEQPGNGDYTDTWNVPVNADMGIIDQAFGGVTSLNATGGSATLNETEYRSLILNISGAISSDVTYTIPSGVGGQWIVRNNVTDASGGPHNVRLAVFASGDSVVVPRNANTLFFSDGSFVRDITVSVFTAGSTDQVLYNDGVEITGSSGLTFDGTTLQTDTAVIDTSLTTTDLTVLGESTFADAVVMNNTLQVANNVTLYNLSVNTNISAAGSITATGNVTAFSDERLKREINTIEDALSKISAMRGVMYVSEKTDKPGTGVIAQEVQRVIPEAVEDNNGMLSVAYGNLVGLLIEGIKELRDRVERLEAKNDSSD
jgi:hypothetical protein